MEMYTLRAYDRMIMYLHVSLHRKNKPRARMSQGYIASYKKQQAGTRIEIRLTSGLHRIASTNNTRCEPSDSPCSILFLIITSLLPELLRLYEDWSELANTDFLVLATATPSAPVHLCRLH